MTLVSIHFDIRLRMHFVLIISTRRITTAIIVIAIVISTALSRRPCADAGGRRRPCTALRAALAAGAVRFALSLQTNSSAVPVQLVH